MSARAVLTEAQLRSGVLFIPMSTSRTSTNSRTVPYAERYRSLSGVAETPAQNLQQAASDEQRRKKKHR